MHTYSPVKTILAASIIAVSSHASIYMQHSGATDPLSEGWEIYGTPQGDITVGTINDNGTQAWFIDDNSTLRNSIYPYVHYLDSADVADAISDGWFMNLTLRVVDVSDAVDPSIAARVAYNNTSFILNFGSQADGDPIVRLGVGTSNEYVLEGTGGGYHDYSLVYDPTQNSADLFVDGTEVLSDYTGEFQNIPSRIDWGGISSFDTGHGNYSSVAFAIPEPSSALLVGMGGILLTRGRKYKTQLKRSLFRLRVLWS